MRNLWWFLWFVVVLLGACSGFILMLTPFLGEIAVSISFWCLIGLMVGLVGMTAVDCWEKGDE
jgi:hypothetical protein